VVYLNTVPARSILTIDALAAFLGDKKPTFTMGDLPAVVYRSPTQWVLSLFCGHVIYVSPICIDTKDYLLILTARTMTQTCVGRGLYGAPGRSFVSPALAAPPRTPRDPPPPSKRHAPFRLTIPLKTMHRGLPSRHTAQRMAIPLGAKMNA